ncbi:MAG TPA: glycoside hydrolase family 95 protein [Tepidisphaeraceae bacterium]|nr:glycoside hydrolase family 95 protein [Tepidisphaeraceae bacterium]
MPPPNLTAEKRDLRLWYRQPATAWEQALPIGNGRLGAMIFGGLELDRLQFNEDTLWTGRPRDYLRANAADALPEIRKLIFAGQSEAAAGLVREQFLSDPVRQKAYQPFGDVRMSFPEQWGVTDYVRELDLTTAVAATTYLFNGTRFTREAFASRPANAIVLHLTADTPASVTCTLRLTSPHKRTSARLISNDTIAIAGQVQDGVPPHELGLLFESRMRCLPKGGRFSCSQDGSIRIERADSVTFLLVAATSFTSFDDISADPSQRCEAAIRTIANETYSTLKQTHISDHQRLFSAAAIDLGHSDLANEPTDKRLQRLTDFVHAAERTGADVSAALSADPALVSLYFQMGRYMLIASSRPGSQPANLQGVWNELLNPPWESKFTTNINFEMNYWLANLTGLGECEQPLFELIQDLRITGGKVAREQYGARGWVLHHNTDLWRGAAPINNIDGLWPTGGAWLCWHLWERYRFTRDRAFLEHTAYPAMREACLFFTDALIEDPVTTHLVTNPSHSPEQGPLSAAPAMDMQLIRALFDSTIAAAEILNADSDLVRQIRTTRARLAPDRIGSHGQLQEWQDDIDSPGNNHRHMSPLWGLYPGDQFTPSHDELFAAAKRLLNWRGDGSTGWSYAWRIPLWARVFDGAFASRQLSLQLCKKTFSNLFDKCGPFQVDGNFGATAGIVEMLLQSHEVDASTGCVVLHLLPALPGCWPRGSATGLGARGGYTVDVSWDGGGLTGVTLRATADGQCVVRHGKHQQQIATPLGTVVRLDGALVRMK